MFWSKEDNRPKLTTIGEILLSAEGQVERYMEVNRPV